MFWQKPSDTKFLLIYSEVFMWGKRNYLQHSLMDSLCLHFFINSESRALKIIRYSRTILLVQQDRRLSGFSSWLIKKKVNRDVSIKVLHVFLLLYKKIKTIRMKIMALTSAKAKVQQTISFRLVNITLLSCIFWNESKHLAIVQQLILNNYLRYPCSGC